MRRRYAVGSVAEERRVVAGAQPAGHRLKGILYRLRNPALVGDTAVRAATGSWHLISPSEFFKFIPASSRAYRVQCGAVARAARGCEVCRGKAC